MSACHLKAYITCLNLECQRDWRVHRVKAVLENMHYQATPQGAVLHLGARPGCSLLQALVSPDTSHHVRERWTQLLQSSGEEHKELRWSKTLFWRFQEVNALRRVGESPSSRPNILNVEVGFALDYVRCWWSGRKTYLLVSREKRCL